jgi:hypothetical protein
MEWEILKSRNSFYLEASMFRMGTVSIYDVDKKELLLYAKARPFKWKGLKVFADKEMQSEMLSIIQDTTPSPNQSFMEKIGGKYAVTDVRQGQQLGYAKYKIKSLFSTNYELQDQAGQVIGGVDQVGKIFLSRMIAFVQPEFEITINGKVVATLKGKFGWYTKKFYLDISDPSVDHRMIMTAAILVLGMEKTKASF